MTKLDKKSVIRQLKRELGSHESNLEETIECLERQVKYYKNKCKKEKEKINKAIDFIENHVVATETEEILIKILGGKKDDLYKNKNIRC